MTYVRTSISVDPNDPTRKAEYDNYFQAPFTVTAPHHEIHEGDMFTGVVYDICGIGDEIGAFILTPATATPQKRIHMTAGVAATGAYTWVIKEGCSYSSGGAAFTPINRNRGSTKTTALQSAYIGGDNLSGGVIAVTGGSAIWSTGGGAGKTVGGQSRDVEEWVLAPNTGYLFLLTSAAASNSMSMEAVWYEHTDE
jgi:hypothetical protein